MADVKYKRVVLKLSGEALAGDQGFGINPPELKTVAKELKEVYALGVQVDRKSTRLNSSHRL